jgi:anaerobic magnesium-protoporphyrin IX monomethyl ester cyclase
MADILLTHSNSVWSDPKQTAKMQPYFPLQTILAAAALRESGVSVSLFDPTLKTEPRGDFRNSIEQHHPRMVAVCEDDFNFLSKMCLAQNRSLAFAMAEIAAEAGITAIAHGSDASDHPAEYLKAGFTAVLIGEVEASLVELASGKAFTDIPGLAWSIGGVPRFNSRPPLRENLDALALPAWDLVDIHEYRGAWTNAHGYFSVNMVTSRGCPFGCNWCAKPIYGDRYHVRSPHAVATEMRVLKDTLAPDHIWFADDIFALSPRWTIEFTSAVRELDARIPFRMQSRCDLMTRGTVAALADAGCCEVWMGAESGSQRILDAMNKGIRAQDIPQARENLRRHGIRACYFLQFGYPGETWAEIEETIDMVRRTRPDDVGVSVSYPLPGTRFHQIVSSQLGSKSNWNDSSDLAMMFRGAYSTAFYRALADALHVEVRGGDRTQAWNRVDELRAAGLSEATCPAEVDSCACC